MRRYLALVVALLLLASLTWATVAYASDPGVDPVKTGCEPPTTDTDVELGTELGPATLRNVRAGLHPCFDRVVYHVAGPVANGVRVRYVPELISDPKGDTIPVPNSVAVLQVVIPHAVKASQADKFAPGDLLVHQNLHRFPSLRTVLAAGCFEGQCTTGVGLRETLPFRVFTIQQGQDGMVVVDIAHDPAPLPPE